MDSSDFWTGVRLVVTGLTDAAKKASYSLGFGAGGFGSALLILSHYHVSGPPYYLISMSAFFIFAKFGKAIDDRLERNLIGEKLKDYFRIDEMIDRRISKEGMKNHELISYMEKDQREEMRKIKEELQQLIKSEPEKIRKEVLDHLEMQKSFRDESDDTPKNPARKPSVKSK